MCLVKAALPQRGIQEPTFFLVYVDDIEGRLINSKQHFADTAHEAVQKYDNPVQASIPIMGSPGEKN